jgi:hypothetical protein
MFYGNVTLVDRLAIFGHTDIGHANSDAVGLRPPRNPDNPLSSR